MPRSEKETCSRALWERPRPGSPYLLEPELKDGAGGRRDFDELTWTAAILTGAPQGDPAALVSLGLLAADEAARLEHAADLVAAARWELQRLGSESLMTLDAAEEMHTDAQQVQQGLADTHHLLLRTRERVAQRGRHDTGQMSSVDVLDLAMRGRDGLPGLEQAGWAGRLDALVPGYSALMVLRRPGLAHTLTVGAHCLKAATLLSEIGSDDGLSPGGEIAARSARALDDSRVPVVAALVHDVGKEVPGADHAERGVETARATATRFGLEEHADDVAELVRLHLLLPETAARDDLDDENVILRTAARIHRRELLAPLHLLTIADSLATGPAAWTGWHEALIGKLVTRLDAALSPDVDGAGIADAADLTRDAALAQVPAASREAHFIGSAPERYLADRDPLQVIRHAFLVAGLAGTRPADTHEVDITIGPLPKSFDVTVVAVDRPGLLASIAGCFALSGLDILGVQAFTLADGIALDAFTVHSATLADVGTDTWARFERNLSAALRDRLALGVRLAERQRHYRQTRTAAPEVRIDTTNPYAAVVTVQAHDRLGLFYDVTRAISDSGLDIVGVTATTKHGRAVDTFRVVRSRQGDSRRGASRHAGNASAGAGNRRLVAQRVLDVLEFIAVDLAARVTLSSCNESRVLRLGGRGPADLASADGVRNPCGYGGRTEQHDGDECDQQQF